MKLFRMDINPTIWTQLKFKSELKEDTILPWAVIPEIEVANLFNNNDPLSVIT